MTTEQRLNKQRQELRALINQRGALTQQQDGIGKQIANVEAQIQQRNGAIGQLTEILADEPKAQPSAPPATKAPDNGVTNPSSTDGEPDGDPDGEERKPKTL